MTGADAARSVIPSRGRFIALEGVEGAGKSTLLTQLAARLTADGHRVVTTREPGGTAGGDEIRRLLIADGGYAWTPMAELLLLNAARIEHVTRRIRPALAEGAIVLCDRYAGSSLAYQGAGRALGTATIAALHRLALDDFWPDLTLILDLDPATGLARSKRRLAAAGSNEGKFEALDLDFHERVRAGFLAQAAASPDRHAVITADADPASVLDAAYERVSALF